MRQNPEGVSVKLIPLDPTYSAVQIDNIFIQIYAYNYELKTAGGMCFSVHSKDDPLNKEDLVYWSDSNKWWRGRRNISQPEFWKDILWEKINKITIYMQNLDNLYNK